MMITHPKLAYSTRTLHEIQMQRMMYYPYYSYHLHLFYAHSMHLFYAYFMQIKCQQIHSKNIYNEYIFFDDVDIWYVKAVLCIFMVLFYKPLVYAYT